MFCMYGLNSQGSNVGMQMIGCLIHKVPRLESKIKECRKEKGSHGLGFLYSWCVVFFFL